MNVEDSAEMPTVLVSAKGVKPGEGGVVGQLAEAGLELRFSTCEPTTPVAEVIKLVAGCQIVVAGGEPYTEEVFAASPALRHIARFGVGYDRIDLAAATAHSVVVTITPGTLEWAVADHTVALMLALAHDIVRRDATVRGGGWDARRGRDFWGRTLGIVGLGRIGRQVALCASGFQMRILACEQQPDHDFVREHYVELVALEQLLRESDFVTLHLPLTSQTRHVIDAEKLAWMKNEAYLINTSRGPLVDQDALYAALKAGQIAGAGLDVYAEEPPGQHPITELDNVVLTPHCAAKTWGVWQACGDRVARAVFSVLRREKPDDLLNPEVWPRFLARLPGADDRG